MRWSRLVGLFGALLIAVVALASVAQLVEGLFDHGGMLPTLVLLVAFLVVLGRIGITSPDRLANPYW